MAYTLHHNVQASNAERVGNTSPPPKLGSGIGQNDSHQLKNGAAELSEGTKKKVQGRDVFKIQKNIEKKYGGLARANQSAIVIQTAYRQYQLKKLYDEIHKKRGKLHKLKQLRPSRMESRHVVDQKSNEHALSATAKETAKKVSRAVVSM